MPTNSDVQRDVVIVAAPPRGPDRARSAGGSQSCPFPPVAHSVLFHSERLSPRARDHALEALVDAAGLDGDLRVFGTTEER